MINTQKNTNLNEILKLRKGGQTFEEAFSIVHSRYYKKEISNLIYEKKKRELLRKSENINPLHPSEPEIYQSLFEWIGDRTISVSEAVEFFKMPYMLISMALSRLSKFGLFTVEKKGNFCYYSKTI